MKNITRRKKIKKLLQEGYFLTEIAEKLDLSASYISQAKKHINFDEKQWRLKTLLKRSKTDERIFDKEYLEDLRDRHDTLQEVAKELNCHPSTAKTIYKLQDLDLVTFLNYMEIHCLNCGKSYLISRDHARANKRFFCTEKCKQEFFGRLFGRGLEHRVYNLENEEIIKAFDEKPEEDQKEILEALLDTEFLDMDKVKRNKEPSSVIEIELNKLETMTENKIKVLNTIKKNPGTDSLVEIAKETKVSLRTVRKLTKELSNYGLIELRGGRGEGIKATPASPNDLEIRVKITS